MYTLLVMFVMCMLCVCSSAIYYCYDSTARIVCLDTGCVFLAHAAFLYKQTSLL